MFYVYFIRANKWAIKIGSTNNVPKRLKALQTGNHEKLKVVASIGFDTEKEARGYEEKLHRLFRSQHIRGEWFESTINVQKANDPLARFKLKRKQKEMKKRRDIRHATGKS